MMKTKQYIMLLFAMVMAAIAFTSCDKPFSFSEPLRLQCDVLNLPATEGATPIIVFANKEWSCDFEQPQEWVRLTVSSGTGLGEAKIEYDANPGSERSAVLVFTAEGKSLSMNINQAGI